MSLIASIGHLATSLKSARARYLTERQIGALPFEIQKDIGWRIEADIARSTTSFDRHMLRGSHG